MSLVLSTKTGLAGIRTQVIGFKVQGAKPLHYETDNWRGHLFQNFLWGWHWLSLKIKKTNKAVIKQSISIVFSLSLSLSLASLVHCDAFSSFPSWQNLFHTHTHRHRHFEKKGVGKICRLREFRLLYIYIFIYILYIFHTYFKKM